MYMYMYLQACCYMFCGVYVYTRVYDVTCVHTMLINCIMYTVYMYMYMYSEDAYMYIHVYVVYSIKTYSTLYILHLEMHLTCTIMFGSADVTM